MLFIFTFTFTFQEVFIIKQFFPWTYFFQVFDLTLFIFNVFNAKP
jgi:hypothetical protein